MAILTATHSSYPRIGDVPEEQVLARAVVAWERGLGTDDDLLELQQELIRDVIHEQTDAGIHLVTDGQVRWFDPISHMVGGQIFHADPEKTHSDEEDDEGSGSSSGRRPGPGLKGVRPGRLIRWFDTSFYVRQAVVTDRIEWTRPLTVGDYDHAVGVTDRPVKPVVTGPYTLARYSDRSQSPYASLAELAGDYARAVGEEVKALFKAGARLVQLDEPAILRHPEDFITLRGCLEVIAGIKGHCKLLLATCFGDATPLFRDLSTLPVEALGLDLISGPGLVDRIASDGSEKPLALGIVDGRNTRLEKAETLAAKVDRMVAGLPKGDSWITSSCGLELIPRDAARAKCRLLGQVKELLGREPVPAAVSEDTVPAGEGPGPADDFGMDDLGEVVT